jgi:hypothetical protein
MTPGLAGGAAVAFVWLGMVHPISFLEAPLKFRAPEVTLRIGLGIGRLVFRALNIVEAGFAAALIVAIVAGHAPALAVTAAVMVIALLIVQLAAVRPRLTRRSDRILAGQDAPRSRSHYAYIALETAKVIALIVTGALLLAT